MMLSNLKRWYLEKRLHRVVTRIAVLEKAVQGTDETMWPEVVADYRSELQQLSFKRLNLLNALERN